MTASTASADPGPAGGTAANADPGPPTGTAVGADPGPAAGPTAGADPGRAASPAADAHPSRIALVLAAAAGGTGTHVAMLAAGLAARGHRVLACGPASTDERFGFPGLPGVRFAAVEIGDRPRPFRDLRAVLALRRLLRRADVVHAHGLRAGALAAVALRMPPRRGQRLVVTSHNAPPEDGAMVYKLLERIVARTAGVVLCVSGDLMDRMRSAGARQVLPAVVPAPGHAVIGGPRPHAAAGPARRAAGSTRRATAGPRLDAAAGAGLPLPAGRPVVLAAGRLTAQKGFGTLLRAATRWQDLDPRPLLVIAGDGPLASQLRAQAGDVDALFAGHREDLPALLDRASVFALPSRWEGQPLVLQEALRAAAPVVAFDVGGVAAVTGPDAAVLVPPGDAAAFGAAVRSVLADQRLAAALRAAASRRAAELPTPDDAVASVIAAYTAAPSRT